jgi:hypothetical protein
MTGVEFILLCVLWFVMGWISRGRSEELERKKFFRKFIDHPDSTITISGRRLSRSEMCDYLGLE